MYKELCVSNLVDIDKTISKDIFKDHLYCWNVLPLIGEFIKKIGKNLSKELFEEVEPYVWIAKSAKVSKTSFIQAPCIIDENTELRHCAFIRGNVIIGKECVIGNSVEIKNSIIFDKAQIPHYNYIGDSIVGYKSHFGAQSLTSNVKSDKTLTCINFKGEKIETGLKKFGAIVGDNVEIGCSTVLNPATVIGRNTNIYPLNSVRGYIDENSIYKKESIIVKKI